MCALFSLGWGSEGVKNMMCTWFFKPFWEVGLDQW